MLRKLQTKKEQGFTIIEVLIVLAIAGLIMLIVFLAVPALQRNSRNNGRNSDASRVAAAARECMSNRNNAVASCATATNINAGTLSQLTDAFTFGIGGLTAPVYSQSSPHISFGNTCDSTGSSATGTSGGASSLVVTFQVEPNINRCING